MNKFSKQGTNLVEGFQERWITKGIDKEGIDYLEKLGIHLCDKEKPSDSPGRAAVTVSQIRNVFGEITRINSMIVATTKKKLNSNEEKEKYDKVRTDFLLLRPKIAYNAARVIEKQRGESRIKVFRDVLDKAHRIVDSNEPKQISNFTQVVECLVAYHKVYGGKEK